jgi:hypothetical protein
MEKQKRRKEEGENGKKAGRGPVFKMTGRTLRKPGDPRGERVEIKVEEPRRSCSNCVFCICAATLWLRTLMSGLPLRGMCVNHPDTPGQWREIPGRACRNFRAKIPPVVRVEPPTPPSPLICYIPLTRGLHAIVDAADYKWLSQYKWFASRAKVPYACRTEKRTTVMMHRLIMQPPKGMVVDHRNGNGLDNRRGNLRVCTQEQNMQNSRGRAVRKSRFKGVFPRGDRWQATVTHHGDTDYLGLFDDEVEAAMARDRRALEVFGASAWLNLPPASPPNAK